jgi:hypothetical protein
MTEQGKHTALPWKLQRKPSGDMSIITDLYEIAEVYSTGEEDSKANARLIVRAVNSFERNEATIKALVEALEFSLKYLHKASADGMETVVPVSKAISKAEAALKLAQSEGE